jgi:hypothetical protein
MWTMWCSSTYKRWSYSVLISMNPETLMRIFGFITFCVWCFWTEVVSLRRTSSWFLWASSSKQISRGGLAASEIPLRNFGIFMHFCVMSVLVIFIRWLIHVGYVRAGLGLHPGLCNSVWISCQRLVDTRARVGLESTSFAVYSDAVQFELVGVSCPARWASPWMLTHKGIPASAFPVNTSKFCVSLSTENK